MAEIKLEFDTEKVEMTNLESAFEKQSAMAEIKLEVDTEEAEMTNLESAVEKQSSGKRTLETLLCESCKKKKVDEEDRLLKPYEGFDDTFTHDEELIYQAFVKQCTIDEVPIESFIKNALWTTQIVNFITDKIAIWFDKDDTLVMRVRRPDNSVQVYNANDFYKITAIFYATRKSKPRDKFVAHYFEPAALSSASIFERDGIRLNRFISVSDHQPQRYPSSIPEKSTDSYIFVVKNGFVNHKVSTGETMGTVAYIKFNNILYQLEKK